MKKEKIILFDLDGTIIDSTEAILESFKETYRNFGGEIPKDEAIKAEIGYPLRDMYISLGIDENMVDEYVRRYKEHYKNIHTKKTFLIPGAKEAVEKAYKFARLGIVTTKTGKYSKELMEHFGLMKYFEVLIGSEDVSTHKPSPEPIFKALELMGRTNERVWMIGDTCMDMLSAKRAGVDAIGVCSGYGCRIDLTECSPKLVENVTEAVSIIELA